MFPNISTTNGSPGKRGALPSGTKKPQVVILSFDVEEHHRIEAAAGLEVAPSLQARFRSRVAPATRWLLDELEHFSVKATFFIVGEIAKHSPGLIRAVHDAGHEVACHGWDHQRIHHFTPELFREDVHRSKDTLEQICGAPVLGYRAPTFSIVAQTGWAIDVLAELGMRYDSSIYPVWHDLYGVPQAPRTPFRARGHVFDLLEFPPATLRISATNVPVGGGGYFRLFPLAVIEYALQHVPAGVEPNVAMLYFHPWEFDPGQARLPLAPLNLFRTYVGIHRSRPRLATLLGHSARYSFIKASDAAKLLSRQKLPSFDLISKNGSPLERSDTNHSPIR